jgi:hypothetical protein
MADVLYIDLNDLDIYYKIYKDNIDKNGSNYVSFFINDPKYRNDYLKIYNEVNDNIIIKNQQGGDLVTGAIIGGTVTVMVFSF